MNLQTVKGSVLMLNQEKAPVRPVSRLVDYDSDGKLGYALDERGDPYVLDFSHAGYHAAERGIPDVTGPVFDVTGFGAVPNDGKDDQEAIQRAIDAAEKAGGGVVFFPPGIYHVNSDLANRKPLRITSSGIVLRGSGGWEGGTEIRIVHPTIQVEPKPLEPMGGGWLQIGVPTTPEMISRLTENIRKNESLIVVEDGKAFEPGMFISLRVNRSREIVKDVIAPYTMEDLSPLWTRCQNDGISLVEHHVVQKVDGNRVTLREPVKTEMKTEYGWHVTTYETCEEIGIEDICFQGEWIGNFYHHRSVLDDNGWEAIRFTHTVNSWVRRCSFINLNSMINFEASSYLSVLHLDMGGAMGHSSMGTPRRCTGILVGLSREILSEQTGVHSNHSIGSAGSGAGHVFWRYEMHPDQAFDFHGMFPYATLFDKVVGGDLTTTGGPNASFPNHLKDFVVWNFKHVKEPSYRNPKGYDFWTAGHPEIGRPNIVKPVIVGMHGHPVRFVEETVGVLDSLGQEVTPESLYEAQLMDRLGFLPEWVTAAKEEWEELQKKNLPVFLRGSDATNQVAVKRSDIIRFTMETPMTAWPFFKEGDPIQELLREWPALDECPWPPYIAIWIEAADDRETVHLYAEEGCTIRYTTDGRNPDSESQLYQGPIPVEQSGSLQAIAIRADGSVSHISRMPTM